MKIRHFTGDGYGVYQGVFEIFIMDEDDTPVEDSCPPRFKLSREVDVSDAELIFPIGIPLIPLD